ncbi:chromosome partitioning protein ParA [Pseudomonas sp. CAN2814]|uniref:chromosome partitioning protein ParA n=1 Tax=Pseudomonas sp. CAN1 TaxID=3046726 RepID=UPI00264A03F8|nr:chromosome partitioning protein ParA [Pseudomonas sp. CAN1]MDN6856788.1 chromosome partitioning protein ParA [Pseudomonas sp. CAN1]
MEHPDNREDVAKQDAAAQLLRDTEIALREAIAKSQHAVEEDKQRIAAEREALARKAAELSRREDQLKVAEQQRAAGHDEERAALNAELRQKRAEGERRISEIREQQLSALEEELANLRARRLSEVSAAGDAERERMRDELNKQREAWTKQQDDARARLDAELSELAKQKGALSAMQSEVHGRAMELEAAERNLERKEQRLEQQSRRRSEQFADELETNLEEARRSLEMQKQSCIEDNRRLRETLAIQADLLGVFEQLKRQLGDKDPSEILRDLNSQTDELKRLREELANRPTEEMRDRTRALENETKAHKARADELARQIASKETEYEQVGQLRRKNSELTAENQSLMQKASIFEGAAEEAQVELKRLRAAYERPAEVEARHKEIERPHFAVDRARLPVKAEIDELTWLKGIGNACSHYGLSFNPRILNAFHTALKTAEWSPLTVLSGVSGTGKSELPRLYAHFGGIFFEPLSVQPNWDSQESMLGFFNSIDNKFDAQPVLNFLAQSQKPWSEDYPGLSEAVCLVLLDEMNLAHPELYFAEFLSKLELRRGRKGNDVPCLPVKVGAGMPPYKLPLGRNVLWAGTMNQDETTKSLSDKVLDRSIIVNFPRPTELKRRLRLQPLDDRNRGPALHREAWNKWLAQGSSFTEDEVKPFMAFIETLNGALSVSGRALGHRVWQSIEYYMANYPEVRAAKEARDDKDTSRLAHAMHTAFEDQLVQKVMPKLRGIDTRGKSKTDCLDKIRHQLGTGIAGRPFNLTEDFDIACELGYGQFIWQSANYLNASDSPTALEHDAHSAIPTSNTMEEPPALFNRGLTDPDERRRVWNLKSPENRNELRRTLEENARKGRIADHDK